MKWGLSHNVDGKWGYIIRFDIDTTQRDVYRDRTLYEKVNYTGDVNGNKGFNE